MTVKYIPEGYHTITPYLVVEGADKLIEFIEKTFGGEVKFKMEDETGRIGHAEMKIGDSTLMLAEVQAEWKPTNSMLQLYVEDADAVYQKALDAGAVSIKEPADQFYGDRSATVKDSTGNVWNIATHIEEISEEELNKRTQAVGLMIEK